MYIESYFCIDLFSSRVNPLSTEQCVGVDWDTRRTANQVSVNPIRIPNNSFPCGNLILIISILYSALAHLIITYNVHLIYFWGGFSRNYEFVRIIRMYYSIHLLSYPQENS